MLHLWIARGYLASNLASLCAISLCASRRTRAMSRWVATRASNYFTGAERFDEIVVRATPQPFDSGLFACARGEQNDGNGLEGGVVAQGLKQSEAVQLRHHDIAENQNCIQLV